MIKEESQEIFAWKILHFSRLKIILCPRIQEKNQIMSERIQLLDDNWCRIRTLSRDSGAIISAALGILGRADKIIGISGNTIFCLPKSNISLSIMSTFHV